MIEKTRSLALAVLCVLSISGCAVGNKHQYAESIPSIKVHTAKSLSVGVLDKRTEIMNKSKTEDFVGVQRGGFGNPFDVTTASGKPLATDITTAVTAALRQDGANAREVPLSSSLQEMDAMKAIAMEGTDRGILLTLTEWKADTMTNTALHYDVRLAVFDPSGKVLSTNEIKGNDHLGGSFMNPPEHAKTAVPAAFKTKMETLFSNPDISKALR